MPQSKIISPAPSGAKPARVRVAKVTGYLIGAGLAVGTLTACNAPVPADGAGFAHYARLACHGDAVGETFHAGTMGANAARNAVGTSDAGTYRVAPYLVTMHSDGSAYVVCP